MQWLMFDLASSMASFGSVAPGEVRDTELLPSRSALLGLLGAALGLRREESARQRELAEQLHIAARVNADARLEHDYHTAQAPPQPALKGRPRSTRRDELSVPRNDLNTVLSDRYYYADYAATIGVAGPSVLLDECQEALRSPHFTLYLGRKCCAPCWPMDPHRVEAVTWADALRGHDERADPKLQKFDWSALRWIRSGRYRHALDRTMEIGDLGQVQTSLVWRWDEPIDTARRLYANRQQRRLDQSPSSTESST